MSRFAMLRRIPPRAWPQVLRQRLRRRRAARRWPPAAVADPGAALMAAYKHPADYLPTFLYNFRYRPTRKFFVPANSVGGDAPARAADVIEALPEARYSLLAEGEKIIAHRFDVLGSGERHWGDPIRWRWDPLADYEWPLSGAPLVDLSAGRDIKLPWELSRFHHAVTLGQCYAISGDERYAREFAAQLAHWWADNPPGYGIHWANAMEVAIRAANLIWAFELAVAAKTAITEKFTVAYLNSLFTHGRYIFDHLEDYYPANNHYLANM